MEQKFDITALGELLMDLTPCGVSPSGRPLLEVNPGGAPCNVLAMAANLGSRCAFLGKVGADSFGRSLKQTITQMGISSCGLRQDPSIPTTLAVVSLDESGERSFSFYRKPGADLMLRPDEVDYDIIAHSTVFHFGTLSLTGSPSKDALTQAISHAQKSGCILSFDPNIRLMAWEEESQLRDAVSYGLAHCDCLKMSDEEITYYTGENDPMLGLQRLTEQYPGIKLIVLTLGPDGCILFSHGGILRVPGFSQPSVVDTTGAGDSFWGTFLHFIALHGLCGQPPSFFLPAARQANAAASIIIGRKGALLSMPHAEEINALLP